MAKNYTRKTRDEYHILQYTGQQYGWEHVHTEETLKDAKRSTKEYRANQPEYMVRCKKRRLKIEQGAAACTQ